MKELFDIGDEDGRGNPVFWYAVYERTHEETPDPYEDIVLSDGATVPRATAEHRKVAHGACAIQVHSCVVVLHGRLQLSGENSNRHSGRAVHAPGTRRTESDAEEERGLPAPSLLIGFWEVDRGTWSERQHSSSVVPPCCGIL
jgi:hypothetical protein